MFCSESIHTVSPKVILPIAFRRNPAIVSIRLVFPLPEEPNTPVARAAKVILTWSVKGSNGKCSSIESGLVSFKVPCSQSSHVESVAQCRKWQPSRYTERIQSRLRLLFGFQIVAMSK